ncbi:MAG TPA: dicarboxylate/amino acid:cation symporter [Gemmatimonadaceae bacterium]|nr:dicarboxylate/amino acid:cation symporter [Gemmatimonadaceae bacterium]
MKESTRVVVSLVSAVAIGIAIGASHSAPLLRAADFIAPLGTLWVNAIRMTVFPLVVSLIITGVASATDVASVGKLGGRTLLVFILLLVGTALVVMPFAPALFSLLPNDAVRPPLPAGAAQAASEVAASGQSLTFAQWLTSLIPSNPIAAAANGQIVPLIIFTLLFGLAITRTPPAARGSLVGFFQALGDAMLVLVRWIILLAPIGVFALVLPIAARAGTAFVGAIGFYMVAYSVASLVVTALLYPVVVFFARIPLRRFARAALPAQLVALSTSSSLAALPALVEGAERELELPERVTGFVLPLAVSMFKIAGPVSWTVGALFIGWFYGVPLGVRELGTIAVASVFLGFAGPGIPRGAFISLAPLFVAIGLPAEGIGILIAVDAIPDIFSTVLNTTGNLAATAIVARTESVTASP